MQSHSSAHDTGYAPERWAFDSEVSRVFGDMINRSIPQYGEMRSMVASLARRFVQPNSHILDLGCSHGDALASLLDVDESIQLRGVEISDPMLEIARSRFSTEISSGRVAIEKLDLRTDFPKVRSSVTLAVLTLMFVPIEYRQRVIDRIFRSTEPGGALIIVEKVIGSGANIADVMIEEYHAMKIRHGYSLEDVDRKRFALEGVLVPMTHEWNHQMLLDAGFRHVDCFWRWMNFAGFIALRD